MSYAIFRVEPINKLKDLGQIGAHNTTTKAALSKMVFRSLNCGLLSAALRLYETGR